MKSTTISDHYLQNFLQNKSSQGHSNDDISVYLNLLGYEKPVNQKENELGVLKKQLKKKTDLSEKMSKENMNSGVSSDGENDTEQSSQKTNLLKLISYLQMSIQKNIPKLTIYAHLIKHGWDKKLVENAYDVASKSYNQRMSKFGGDKPVELKKDTRYLLSKIDELSEQVSLRKSRIALSREKLNNLNSKRFSKKIHSKYTASHFYTKIRKNMPHVKVADKPKEAKKSLEESPHDAQLKKITEELAYLNNKIAGQSQSPQAAEPSYVLEQQENIPQAKLKSDIKTQLDKKDIKAKMEQVKNIAKKSSSYKKPNLPPEALTIHADSINVVGDKKSNPYVGSAEVGHNTFHDEGGEFGLYNPLTANKLEYTEEPVGNRVPTGVPDLDIVISGGLKPHSTTLISGGAGTGKSTFGLQYIVNGIIKHNEPGIYITFEQTREAVISLGNQFGWDLEHLESEGMLIIHEYIPEQISKALQAGGGSVRDMVDSIKAKRVVIDSITEYKMLFRSEIDQRKELTIIFKSFAKWGCTTLIVGQEHSISRSHVSSVLDYESDAVILLYNERRGDIRQRSLEIYKMRDTKHAGRIFPMELTNHGMLVHTKESKLIAGRR